MPTSPHYDVFLSHNSADRPAVEEIARRLVKAGLQPWLDTWNLIPGDPWQEAIEDALRDCAACAVFIGPSGTGPWQNEEMRVAIDHRVGESRGAFRMIPVLLPGAERGERSRLPDFLVRATWVEFRRTLDDETAFHRLVAGEIQQEGRKSHEKANVHFVRFNRVCVCATGSHIRWGCVHNDSIPAGLPDCTDSRAYRLRYYAGLW